MRRLLLVAAVALVSCNQAGSRPWNFPTHTAHQRAGIVNGTADNASGHDDPSVIEIYYTDGSSFGETCTGEMIGGHTVLTAAHCADDSEINPSHLPLCNNGITNPGNPNFCLGSPGHLSIFAV